MATKTQSLAHTKWLCKYHIVFTPKYRRKVIYNQYRNSLREILRRLCEYKGVKIIEGELMADHVHMLVLIPPKISVSSFPGKIATFNFSPDCKSICAFGSAFSNLIGVKNFAFGNSKHKNR